MSKGRKAELSSGFPVGVRVIVDEGKVVVERTGETKNIGHCMDLYKESYVKYDINFHQVYQRVLETPGTGYRALCSGQ